MKKINIIILLVLLGMAKSMSQSTNPSFTKADTLRGSITPERAWWDVRYYDLHVQPNAISKTISGYVDISFKVLEPGKRMQIDLQQPLIADSIFDQASRNTRLSFERYGNVIWVLYPQPLKKGASTIIRIHYHGTPREAKNPPWDGGISWNKDDQGGLFIATSCQGLGASVWWPCKDHQSDEPDQGARISITTPDSLMDVSNGRLTATIDHPEKHLKTWVWEVTNPINNYNISMNIARYAHFEDTLMGASGMLTLNYYVLPSHLEQAKEQFKQAKPMLHCFEYWFGPYPFYKDGYKLVEVPYLGMEHQSAVTYGNGFRNGYRGRDLSGSGWGMKWDFIIIHESGHEWFGNNITTNDIADEWVHEGFTNFSETLYTEWITGKQAGTEYNYGIRKNISNRSPIIGPYHVNGSGGNDMYYKGSNMIQSIRNSMDDDEQFRLLLRHLNQKFYHKTINSADLENEISAFTKHDYSKVFDQYLRNTAIPELVLNLDSMQHKISYQYINCIEGFDLPIHFWAGTEKISLSPIANQWKTISLKPETPVSNLKESIEKNFYIKVNINTTLH